MIDSPLVINLNEMLLLVVGYYLLLFFEKLPWFVLLPSFHFYLFRIFAYRDVLGYFKRDASRFQVLISRILSVTLRHLPKTIKYRYAQTGFLTVSNSRYFEKTSLPFLYRG